MRSALLIAVTLLGWLPAQESESPKEAPPPEQPAAEQPDRRQGPQPARAAEQGIGLYRADMMQDLAWRNLGPSNPIGRVTDIEVPRQKQSIWYIGTAGGGVWKTDNAGTTFEPLFDRQATVSIGDIAVAPANPDIVWVGTGEENARNSVQWGDGVYKSTDGGGSWQHMGLRQTFQIGHIAIHPQNPDIVYVAALGQLWGSNDERGVYRTRDGGKTWERVLFLDDKTGCIDVRIDPQQPDTVYACMFERRRNEFDDNDPAVRMGKGAGLYKSTDGGNNWRQLTTGLPSCEWGRSGISIYEKDPAVLFAIIETERSGWASGHDKTTGGKPRPQPQGGQGGRRGGPRGGDLGIGFRGDDGDEAAPGAVLTEVSEAGAASKAGIAVGDRVTKIDATEIKSYDDLRQFLFGTQPEQKVQLTFVRGDAAPKTVALTVAARAGGGGAPNGPNGGRLNGQAENVQDYQGDDGFETGGVFRSRDHGETWTRVNSLTERPFYYSIIAVDAQDEQNLYCVGTTLWGSFDGGKKFEGVNRGIHVDFHAIWVDPKDSNHVLAGCDGGLNETFDKTKTWQVHTGFSAAQFYHVVADNSVPYNVVGGLQDNGTWVGPSRTRYREGITTEDWCTIYGGDGFGAATDPVEPWIVFATSQNGAMGMVDMRSGGQVGINRGRAPAGRAEFNWDAPFFLSPHNRLVLYQAGNFAWRGDRYAHLDNRQNRQGYGPVQNQDRIRMTAISPRLGLTEKGTATAFAESPRVRGLLYVGTDDGALWRSGDGGEHWQEIHANVPGVGGPRYVSKLAPSSFQDDRVYLAMDGHRSNDFHCYAYVSDDRGDTWHYLAWDLASCEPAHAVVEDPRNENLLYLGTEFGCYASLDRGSHWFPLGSGLPTVAVRDLFVQDRDSELVAATHGRGVFVLDIEPLRQFTAAIARGGEHLFAPKDGVLWRMTSRGAQGQRGYRAPNPPYGVALYLYLPARPQAAPTVTVHDVTGKQVAELTGKQQAGLQALQWDARAGRNQLAPPGAYSARFKVGDDVQIRAFTLHTDPGMHGADDAEASTNPGREKE